LVTLNSVSKNQVYGNIRISWLLILFFISSSVTSTVVTDLICRGFKTANLYTMSGDWQLNIPKKPAKPIRLTRSKPALSTYPKAEHDKNKTWEVSPDAPFLQELGLTGFVPGKSRAFCRLKLENN